MSKRRRSQCRTEWQGLASSRVRTTLSPWLRRGVWLFMSALSCVATALGADTSALGPASGSPTFCGLRQMLMHLPVSLQKGQPARARAQRTAADVGLSQVFASRGLLGARCAPSARTTSTAARPLPPRGRASSACGRAAQHGSARRSAGCALRSAERAVPCTTGAADGSVARCMLRAGRAAQLQKGSGGGVWWDFANAVRRRRESTRLDPTRDK